LVFLSFILQYLVINTMGYNVLLYDKKYYDETKNKLQTNNTKEMQ